MKFRTLGVALVAGGGLALAALPASPAAAFDDKPRPYPPVDCAGPTGEGTVSKSVLLVGESTVFSGCGFEPGSPVQIEVNGVLETTTTANASGVFSVPINFPTAGTQALAGIGVAPPTAVGAVTPTSPATPPAGILPDPIFPEDRPAETPPSTATVPAAPDVPPAPLPTAPVPGAPDLLQTGLASEIAPPKAALQGGPRIVNASVLVIGLGAEGIVGLPIDPGLIGSWISDWGGDGFGKDHDRDRDRDCFGDGFDKDRDNGDKDRDKVDGEHRDDKIDDDKIDGDGRDGEHRDGLAAAEPTALFDDWDDKDDKDRDDKDRDDKDRDENGDCIVAGGIVGVGGVGGGGVGAGAAGAGGGALPFTGVETGAMASIAVALLGGGVLLRVAARRRRLAGQAQG